MGVSGRLWTRANSAVCGVAAEEKKEVLQPLGADVQTGVSSPPPPRQGTEYQGQRSGDQDDEMCVIVRNPEIKVSDEAGRKYYQEVLSYQQKGIDGERLSTVPLLSRSAPCPLRPAASPYRPALRCAKGPSCSLPARLSPAQARQKCSFA